MLTCAIPAYIAGTACCHTLRYTEEAIRVIKERDAAKPLFMFTAFQNIHPPLQVPSAYMQRYKTPEMQTDVNGMITFLDESIGNITKVVKSEGSESVDIV